MAATLTRGHANLLQVYIEHEHAGAERAMLLQAYAMRVRAATPKPAQSAEIPCASEGSSRKSSFTALMSCGPVLQIVCSRPQ